MHRRAFAAFVIIAAITVSPNKVSAQGVKLIGSGASFPFPIYSAWFKDFSKKNDGVTVDYQAKGSGAGIQDFTNRTVDFAGSDAAMTDEEIAKVTDGVVLLPITAGEIVLAYNLPGNPKALKLTRDVYPDIFLGKVTKWNDPRIIAANPDLKLPDLLITVVRRSDASGTNFVFTKHLSAISPTFAKEVGSGTTVEWPKSDKIVGAPKNDGVTATIKQTPGAIGYIEYGYAKLTKADFALLQNKAGQFVLADTKSGQATLATETLDDRLRGWIEDSAGPDAYPIASFTYLIVYSDLENIKSREQAQALVNFLWWATHDGEKLASELDYAPLSDGVQKKLEAALKTITYQGQRVEVAEAP